MESVSHIDLNFQKPSMQPAIYAKQGDMLSRKIKARLFDGQQAWVPPTDSEVKVIVRCFKPDGTICFYDTTEEDLPAVVTGSTNEITIMLAQQCLTAAGDVKMEINFYTAASSNDEDATGEKLTTFSAVIRVEKSVIDDVSMQSDSYFRVLTSEITRALNAVEYITNLEVGLMPNYSSEEPDVSITGGTSSPYKISFGLPRGPKGDMATITHRDIEFVQVAAPTSGSPSIPTSGWGSSVPVPEEQKLIWTKITDIYNNDSNLQQVSYLLARNGKNGDGDVTSVAGVLPTDHDNLVGDVPASSLLEVLKPSLVDMLYPVGSIYMTKTDDDPNTMFSGTIGGTTWGTTWVEIESRFLVGAGTFYSQTGDKISRSGKTYYTKSGPNDNPIYNEYTGAANTDIRALTLYEKIELGVDSVGGDFKHKLIHEELVPHQHAHDFILGTQAPASTSHAGFCISTFNHVIDYKQSEYPFIGKDSNAYGYTDLSGGDVGITLSNKSNLLDNASFSILPPYVVVHIWERTA